MLSRLPSPGERQPRLAWECQRRASASYDAAARLGEIDVPTLVLHGIRDHMAPIALAHRMEAAIRGPALVEVPGGHISLLTRERRRFGEEALAFLAS
ncbi:MAG TPA: alpha/beta hydrolase [Acidimicrobiales bacterium]|nr:alpha/beta hydrolase [Acidimicrobiales bacterium]